MAGAAPNRFMTNLAMQEADDDGTAAYWGDPVADEDYLAEPAADERPPLLCGRSHSVRSSGELRSVCTWTRPAASLETRRPRLHCGARRLVRDRRRGDWLGTAWTSIFVIYAAAVLPLLGWAILQAL